MRFLETVEGIRCEGVRGLVGMYKERLCAVCLLDVGFGDTGQKVEDCIGIEAERVADTCVCVRSSSIDTGPIYAALTLYFGVLDGVSEVYRVIDERDLPYQAPCQPLTVQRRCRRPYWMCSGAVLLEESVRHNSQELVTVKVLGG